MRQKVLITGASGFIGSRLTGSLPQCDVIPVGRDRDLTDLETVEDVVCTADPDVIVHLAAAVGAKRWEKNGPELFDTNLKIDTNLATVLNEVYGTNRPRVIYASSSEVYQSLIGTPVTEESPLAVPPKEVSNRSLYGLEKIIGEYLLHDINLRLFNIVGPGQNESFALPQMVSRALAGRDIRASNDFRSFCSIDDLVRWISAMINAIGVISPGAYNIGNPDNCSSMITVAMLIKERCDSYSIITQYQDGFNIYRKPDITKASRYYQPKDSLLSIIETLVKNPYFKENA